MPTLKDVAKKAGVSYSTVSYVLNSEKQHLYSEVTINKVKDAARAINYRPHYYARSLKKKQSRVIGVTTGSEFMRWSFTAPYATQIYTGVAEYLEKTDYKLMFHNLKNENIQEIAGSRMVDGFIMIVYAKETFRKETEKYYRNLDRMGIPLVAVHSQKKGLSVPNVGVDFTSGGEEAARHLAGHGYKKIGLVTLGYMTGYGEDTVTGFKRTLADKGVPVDDRYCYTSSGANSQSGYELASRILQEGKDLPEALLVNDDGVAYGMILKFRNVGLQVPGKVAIIGLGDTTSQATCSTDLTTIGQPAREKGYKAAEMLDSLLNHPGKETSITEILNTSLVVRSSCGCRQDRVIY